MRIYLIGFMGCGKSFLGKKVAKQLGYPFIDLDNYISRETNKSIAQLISIEGISKFREIESDILRSLNTSIDQVIATGGGTSCYKNNIDWMNANGATIYLKATPKHLYERLAAEKEERPLIAKFNDDELMEFINDELAIRVPFYQKANHIINVANNDEENILEQIKSC